MLVCWLKFIIMSQLVSDTLYQSLRQKGLTLTPISQLIVPQSPLQDRGLISTFSSLFKRTSQSTEEDQVLTFPILNTAFIVARQKRVYIYKYMIHNTEPLEITPLQTIGLPQAVLSIHSCDQKYVQDRGDVPILLRYSHGVHLFIFDTKEMILKDKWTTKVNGLLGVGWINDREFIILDNYRIHHYSFSQGSVKRKSQLAA